MNSKSVYGLLASIGIAFYILILGIMSENIGEPHAPFTWVGWWHPAALLFVTALMSIVGFIIKLRTNPCSYCAKETRRCSKLLEDLDSAKKQIDELIK